MFASRTDILVKSAIFDNTPAEKWFSPRLFVPWNFLKKLISTIHGGEGLSYDLFFNVTDGQNANTELIPLICC